MRLGRGLNMGVRQVGDSPLEIVDVISPDLTYGWTLPGSVRDGDILIAFIDQYTYASLFTHTFDQAGWTNLDTYAFGGANNYGMMVAYKVVSGDTQATIDPTGMGSYTLLFGSRLAILRKPGLTTVTVVDGDGLAVWNTGSPPSIECLASTMTVPGFGYAHAAEYRSGAVLRGMTTSPSIDVVENGTYDDHWAQAFNAAGEKVNSYIDPVTGAASGRLILYNHWYFDIS